MTFPLTQSVQHLAYDGKVKDSRGNLVDSWAAAVVVAVYGWHISTTHEPQIAGHDRVLVDAQVLAPESFVPAPRDKILLPGRAGEYQVIGETEDFNHGPFGFKPGNRVNLRKVTG